MSTVAIERMQGSYSRQLCRKFKYLIPRIWPAENDGVPFVTLSIWTKYKF